MAFGRTRNRRKVDAQARAKKLRVTAASVGKALFRLCALAVGGVCLWFGGGYAYRWALTSPTFAMKAVRFEGVKRATEVELMRVGGLSVGQNLFKLDLGAAERAMAAHPWVKTVELTRHFPSSVSADIVEHEPVAMISLGDLYLLDESGEPFKKVQPQDSIDLPLVTGVSRDDYVERPDDSAKSIALALRFAGAYQKAGLDDAAPLSEVRVAESRVTLVTGDALEIVLPQKEPDEALKRLLRVRSELSRRGLSADVIHLDNQARPGWVTVQLAKAAHRKEGGLAEVNAPSRE